MLRCTATHGYFVPFLKSNRSHWHLNVHQNMEWNKLWCTTCTSWVQDFCWAQSKTICIDCHMLKASPFKSAKGLEAWPQALITIWALRWNGVILDRHWNNESMFAAKKSHQWFNAFLELWLVSPRNATTLVEVCEVSIVGNAELDHYKSLKTIQTIYLLFAYPPPSICLPYNYTVSKTLNDKTPQSAPKAGPSNVSLT